MRRRESVEDGLPRSPAKLNPQLAVAKQHLQSLYEFIETVDRNQPSVTTLNDFIDALPSTRNYRFTTRHRLQVNAAEAFVAAGQNEDRAVPHRLCHVGAAPPAEKMYSIADAKIGGQSSESFSIRALADD